MKKMAIFLGCTIAVVGCAMSSDEDQMENAIREELTKNGSTVNEVEMTREGDNMVGFAEIRSADGSGGRLRCNATPDTTKSGSYNWRCVPAIDQRVIDQMKDTIRQDLARQAEVRSIELTRQDDMHMTGQAVLTDGNGNEVRTNCTVTRENEGSNHFNYQCNPADSGTDAAPAGGK
jgi:hypothetical protein